MKFSIPAIIVTVFLLFVPIPALAVDIFYLTAWMFAGFVLFAEIKYGKDLKSLPRLLLYVCLFVLAVSISFTRIILNGNRSVLYKYISVLNYNFIVNIFVAITIMVALFVLTKKGVEGTVKVALGFSLETRTEI